MADYLSLAFLVFVINLIPAFMPPTWLILSRELFRDSGFDPLMLALVGAIASTLGRAGLMLFSSFFRRFFSKQIEHHAEEIREFFDKKEKELFMGTFLYALSPFPSNLIFIANGLTKVDWKPIFPAFFLGRLISYYVLIRVSGIAFSFFGSYLSASALDLVGLIAAVSIVFVDWKKFFSKKAKK
ncbi:MAG: hypothetical protein PHS02_04400 [Candidatus ainarchaeum sp.]|nr:hypothetical protein [Candidatus ainarchaeum sp.]